MMGVDLLFLSTGCAVYLIAGYRAVLILRGRRRPSETPLMVIALAFGTAFVLIAPSVQALESALLPSLGRLLSNLCTLVAAFGFAHLMLYVHHPVERVPRLVRRRLLVLLIAAAVMVTMFLLSSPPDDTGIFTGMYRSQPTLAVYTLTYSLYLGTIIIDLGWMAIGSLRHSRTWLRAGMAMIALGCVLAAGYLGQKFVSIFRELATGAVAEPFCPGAFATVPCTFAIGMPALSVVAIVIGIVLPTLGPRVDHAVGAVRARGTYRRLAPLADYLTRELPELAVTEDARATATERLYARVVTIRDGLLLLRPYWSQHTEDNTPHGEATGIRNAVDRRAASDGQAPVPAPETLSTRLAEFDDLADEIRWLTRVADAINEQQRS